MKNLILIFTFFFPTLLIGQPIEQEKWRAELSFNLSNYNSFSASIEKEFRYNNWYFGPRVELLNPFGVVKYNTSDTINNGYKEMRSQFRIQLLRLEWQKNKKLRFGISPFWMLGPIPREGFYQINTSVWASIYFKETKRVEVSLNSAKEIPFQISLRQSL